MFEIDTLWQNSVFLEFDTENYLKRLISFLFSRYLFTGLFLVIVAFATVIAILTSLSTSAISTNGEIGSKS